MNLIRQIFRFFKIARRAGGLRSSIRLVRSAPKYALLFRRLFVDPRVPVWAKVMVIASIAFAVSPLNLPQYIPILGQMDDLGIVLFVTNLFFKQIPPDLLAEHKRAVGLDPSMSRA